MFSQKSTPMPQALPKEFLSRPDLQRHESEFLISLAKEMCMEVIFYAQENGGSVKWKLKDNREGVQIFQGEEFGGNDDLTYVCGVNTIRGTLSDVADLFNVSTDDKLAAYARVFEPDLIDMLSIYDLASPTPENPMHYIGVRWSAVESTHALVKNRDFCYLECQDEFVDTRTNKQGWVRCMHSINIPCCGSLEKSHGYIRGSYYRSGFVVVETDKPGFLDVTHILQVNFKGSVPAWLRRQTLRRRVASIARIDKHFQVEKLSAGRILGDIDLQPKKHVLNCHWCARKFDPFFTRKFRCRKCGEVVCKHCSDHWVLHLPVSGDKRVRICTMCSATCRDDLPPPTSSTRPSSDQFHPPSQHLQPRSSMSDNVRVGPTNNRRPSAVDINHQPHHHRQSQSRDLGLTRFENNDDQGMTSPVQKHRPASSTSALVAPHRRSLVTTASMGGGGGGPRERFAPMPSARPTTNQVNDNDDDDDGQDAYYDTTDSRANNYSFENASFADSSAYETNPFVRLAHHQPPPPPPTRATAATRPSSLTASILRRHANHSELVVDDSQGAASGIPELENRMRARQGENASYIESVRSIQLGSGWDSESRTDLFNSQHFGESEVSLDTLDHEWSRHFVKDHNNNMRRFTPVEHEKNGRSFGSVVSDNASFRYSVQVPQHGGGP
ncbi:Aste57867_14793 [Aphanomyces stellatus]|uniref:Aste57867_14793 protein n=1 Tax=Aphanomyces stellatus TaxID=120398 RepID=A0A485L1M7_9STRA|nr:hypothetical protein As57867_014738 [Aphanomyces stellatus]VFT91611.1 Aste57867_14793 [Aphanomyces stellatus]